MSNISSYILSIDQGTSGTKAVIFDEHAKFVVKAAVELTSYFPQVGYVEQDPLEIYESVLGAVEKCLVAFQKLHPGKEKFIKTCGISNQRETFVLWDNEGQPLCNAIVWQCKRSVSICDRLQKEGLNTEIKNRTGLKIDPYFSGTKLVWLYENNRNVKDAIDNGTAHFGTVDTWLLFKLTKHQEFATDYTNASRTLLFNIYDLTWDHFLLDKFKLQQLKLPEVKHSSANFGTSNFEGLFQFELPITGMIGDSHAAAFGEGCFSEGMAKATLGTGCSILWNTGNKPIPSNNGMMTTICWSLEGRVEYALEGIIISCGSTIEWLKNQLELFIESGETEAMANAVESNEGVYIIPAFSGLGSPHWEMNRKGSIHGLTFKSDKNHIVRAALESIAYQINDVVRAIEEGNGKLKELKLDGGMTENGFLVQYICDLIGVKVLNFGITDASALGAALVSGLGIEIWSDIENLPANRNGFNEFTPAKNTVLVKKNYLEWRKIIAEN